MTGLTSAFIPGEQELSLHRFLRLSAAPEKLELSEVVLDRLARARAVIDRHIENEIPVYGLNTGLGGNLGYRLKRHEIEDFQYRLLAGRSAGTGPALDEDACRGALLARIVGSSRGYSGISVELYKAMVKVYEAGLAPVIVSTGSIGAGDLVLNAQLGLALTGAGEFWLKGEKIDAAAALQNAGIAAARLRAKDAMVIANSSAVTVSQSAQALGQAEKLLLLGQAVGAMSAEAYGANASIFDAGLQKLRPASGQPEAAAFFRRALAGAQVQASRIQDALSFRVMATLFGTARDALGRALREWRIEINAAADSPAVLENGSIHSTANFHTPAIAHSLDSLCIAQHYLASASAQRIIKLMTPQLSGLDKYLSPAGGASAGLVPMQKTAAALLAESRFYAQPASLDAMVVSDMVEDLAPQSLLTAQKLQKQLAAIRSLIGIEALTAAQALDLRRAERLGAASAILHRAIRQKVAALGEDRAMGTEIEKTLAAIEAEEIVSRLRGKLLQRFY